MRVGQRLGGVVVEHRHRACMTIGPASSSGVTKCTVTPVTLDAVFERLALRVHAGKRRQQRRDGCSGSRCGNAAQNAGPSRRMNPARQTSSTPRVANRRDERAIVRLARRVVAVRHHERLDARRPARARARARRRDSRSRPRSRAQPPRLDRLDNRPQIAAAPGDQDGDGGTGLFSTVSAVRGQVAETSRRVGTAPCLRRRGGPNAQTTPSAAARHILPRHQSQRAEDPAFHAAARLSRVSRACSRRASNGIRCGCLSYCVHVESLASGRGSDRDPQPSPSFMHWVSTTHAVRWHRRRKTVGQGPVYQGRFTSRRDRGRRRSSSASAATSSATRSRARLVRRAQDWPWCSLSRTAARSTPVLPLATAPFLASAPGPTTSMRPLTTCRGAAWRGLSPNAAETVENRPVPLNLWKTSRPVPTSPMTQAWSPEAARAGEDGVGVGGECRRGSGRRPC